VSNFLVLIGFVTLALLIALLLDWVAERGRRIKQLEQALKEVSDE
jgi:hypothetical protein